MSPTPQTPPTDRPLTAGDVRYAEGHLDMTHAPSLGAFIGKSLASHVSGNRMPAMSGDNRERIPAHIRERFDRDCESTAKYILDHLFRPATSAASEVEGVAKIVSDEEVARVHGNANFGATSPREVVNEGVRKTAVGYHCGSTMLSILREHGLITKPRPGTSDCDLTKKGKSYGRALWPALASPPVSERERELASALEPFANLGVTSGPEDEPCSIPYRITRGSILRARKALTAQPAGEGK